MNGYCEYKCENCDLGVCSDFERDLHLVIQGKFKLTNEQREKCIKEIKAVEGYDYSIEELQNWTDEDLANTTFSAWLDYCRDKGLM